MTMQLGAAGKTRVWILYCAVAALAGCGGAGEPVEPAPQRRAAALRSSGQPGGPPTVPALVFVSRAIGNGGSIYYAPAKDMPGVGPHSRFDSAAPGQLIVRESDGRLRVLVDGNDPAGNAAGLVDVNAPDVSYDGQRIVFAGLKAACRQRRQGPEGYAGCWRLYLIHADGSGLRQLTQDEPERGTQLRAAGLPQSLTSFDDGDPAWLPNGEIVFSSTRWPSFAHYSGVRTSNLYTVADDGSRLRRISAERNGADRPLVDPLTGDIVFARWWRNHRFAVNSMSTIRDGEGYRQKDGLTADRDSRDPDAEALFRNAWHAAAIRPDGSGLRMWSGFSREDAGYFMYGGSFDAQGRLLANFYPMVNMTEAGGFGGVRRMTRGAQRPQALMGPNEITGDQSRFVAPNAFGIYRLEPGQYYASDAVALADGRLLLSMAGDIQQDYGLYLLGADGREPQPLLDLPGRSELRAKPLQARALPPVLPAAAATAAALPPPAQGPFDGDGSFVFRALNVFFNAPVDTEIVSAPAVGSASTLRFFIDQQRQSTGSFPHLDWPVLIDEAPVSPAGRVPDRRSPANVPLFEQLRGPGGKVPLTGGPLPNGAAHVTGMNFGAPRSVASCVGCHTGHTQIPVPSSLEAIEYSNLAPGAMLSASSSHDVSRLGGLVDRMVQMGEIWRYWISANGQADEQWVRLSFLVPISVKEVRLYNPRPGDQAGSTLQVQRATVELCADSACQQVVAHNTVGRLAVDGTPVPFAKQRARAVRIRLHETGGTFYGMRVAGLAEVEVIAKGLAP
ncbi:TolB family protein [Paucibacter sp. XJ19-41]|uniref:TolB family protein n=1 Tax=Paucibacter sp. XJ19-41 TaxID=2927824 RepID=UPI00234BE414|nr:hypothetical protein [Paucibacter sp. XJ19-41]MDC6167443.1 hypothetical protein [Paucibacter sp. XJ19-41]